MCDNLTAMLGYVSRFQFNFEYIYRYLLTSTCKSIFSFLNALCFQLLKHILSESFSFFFLYFPILSDLAAKTKINITNGDILYQLPLIFFTLQIASLNY